MNKTTMPPGTAEPQIQERAAQPYLAIECEITEGVPAAVDQAFPELYGWLAEQGVTPPVRPSSGRSSSTTPASP